MNQTRVLIIVPVVLVIVFVVGIVGGSTRSDNKKVDLGDIKMGPAGVPARPLTCKLPRE